MATTKITSPDLFNLESLNTALKLPSGTTAERPTSPSTGEWRYNTTTNLVEFWDGGEWRDLQSENIPPINSEHFNTVLYTGTGSAQSITGVGFKPDFVWIKDRDTNFSHAVTDSTRGVGNIVKPNTTDAQSTDAQTITSFDADGFSLGTAGGSFNNNGDNYVAWCWKANGGTTSSNTDGTITSTVQANTKAAFSVVSYTGNAVSGATIGHGLGVEPDIVIVKNLNLSTQSWNTYVKNVTTTNAQFLTLNTADANGNTANPRFIPGNFSSSVFSVGNDNSTNGASGVDTYIAYCFASVAGYSSIGTYTGNGSTNGPIINTGFEPAFLMIKCYSDSSTSWRIYDNKRNTTNPRNSFLKANADDVEETVANQVNFLTNGFQLIGTNNNINGNGRTQMYIAFASDPSAAPALPNSFANKLYTGTGSATSISGLGFSPSLVWLKQRNTTRGQNWYDVLRGAENLLLSNGTGAASQEPAGTTLGSFDTDGFTVGTGNGVNQSGGDYVSWNWKANPVQTINTDGTIQSVVSANQAAGFSIVKYVGNGSSGSTIGHGLSAAPEVIIGKNLQNTTAWGVYVKDNVGSSGNPASERLTLQTSDATTTTTAYWGGTEPTSSVFTVGTENAVNQSGYNTIAYCFTSIAGFSKMGTYTGTGGSNRSITGLGFQPAWIMIKATSISSDWSLFDSSRGSNKTLAAQADAAEVTDDSNGYLSSFDSDGFTTQVGSSDDVNVNNFNETYIYMAFKDNYEYASTGTMAFMLIAGGGGGGVSTGTNTGITYVGCGGGAGGFRGSGKVTGGGCSPQTDISLAAGTYTVTIGAGGSPGVSGSTSSIAGPSLTTITTTGGGRGASSAYQPEGGGSAGGRSTHASANQSAVACEGFPALEGSAVSWQAGGGGAGGAQTSIGSSNASGIGVESAMTGAATYYAGGGAPGGFNTTSRPQPQAGGGGQGQLMGETAVDTPSIITGTINTGAGGGGGSNDSNTGAKGGGGSGGSGFAVLRLKTAEYSGTTTGSPTVTTSGDETIIQFTGSGTYVHS